MRVAHRRTLWMHTAFSLIVCVAIGGIVLIRHDTPGYVLGGLIALYIVGNTYLHYRRNDFEKETLYEYVLLGVAVYIVLLSAVNH